MPTVICYHRINANKWAWSFNFVGAKSRMTPLWLLHPVTALEAAGFPVAGEWPRLKYQQGPWLFYAGLRRGMARSPFSDPPSLSSRLLLSRAIKASKPSRTRAVFSLTPTSLDAFSSILSSMFSVVLMCINMHTSQAEFFAIKNTW